MDPMLVPIRQDMAGFQDFLGSWICGRDPNIVTDIGPGAFVRNLIEDLFKLGMERVDFVLLTHIHVDHAGGLAEFLSRFPMAKIICHAKGIRHLVDPARLWEASLKTLGDLAKIYGEVKPVSEDRFIPHTRAAVPGLEVIETPGHAAHHLSYVYRGNLFVGEAAGVYYKWGDREYLRPATPKPFFMQETLNSIDRLYDLEDQPICYAHYGKASSSKAMLARSREQILRWKTILEGEISKGTDELPRRCMREILEQDPEVRSFHSMDAGGRERERFFLTNTIAGFTEYLLNSRAAE